MAPKRAHQEETPEQRKTRLAVKRERGRLGMSNLIHRRGVEESRGKDKDRRKKGKGKDIEAEFKESLQDVDVSEGLH